MACRADPASTQSLSYRPDDSDSARASDRTTSTLRTRSADAMSWQAVAVVAQDERTRVSRNHSILTNGAPSGSPILRGSTIVTPLLVMNHKRPSGERTPLRLPSLKGTPATPSAVLNSLNRT